MAVPPCAVPRRSREADLQYMVVELGAAASARRPGRAAARGCAASVPTSIRSSSAWRDSAISSFIANGSSTDSRNSPSSRDDRVRPAVIEVCRRIGVAVQRLPQLAQHLQPHHLAVEERRVSGPGSGRRPAPPSVRSAAAPRASPGSSSSHVIGQDAVGDDQVGRVAVQVEVGEGALRLLDDDLLQGQHDPHRCQIRVDQQVVHVLQLAEELLAGVEDLARRASACRPRAG